MQEPKGLIQLLTITEDLLFSFPLPADIVKKYEFLRSGIFTKLDLQHDFAKAWRMQREAHARAAAEKGIGPYKALFEDIFRSVDGIHEVCRRYRANLEDMQAVLSGQNGVIRARLDGTKEPFQAKSKRIDTSELPPIDLSDLSALTRHCQLYREAEAKEQEECSRLKREIDGRLGESRLLSEQMLAVLAEQIACVKGLEIELQTEETAKKTAEERLVTAVKQLNEEKQGFEAELRRQLQFDFNQKIERVKAEKEEEIRRLTPKLSSEIDDKNAALRKEIDRIRSQNIATLEEERQAHELRESQLQESTQQLTDMLRELRERLKQAELRDSVFREILRAVFEKAHFIYNKFARTNAEWGNEVKRRRELVEKQLGDEMEQYVDQLLEVDFLSFFIQKLDSDNRWLAEKLADLSQENDKMRRASPAPSDLHRQIWADVQQSASALKEFEQARTKLLQQFQEKGEVRSRE